MKCHRIFILARKDGVEAQKLFQQISPHQNIPEVKFFEENYKFLHSSLAIPESYRKVPDEIMKRRFEFVAAMRNVKED